MNWTCVRFLNIYVMTNFFNSKLVDLHSFDENPSEGAYESFDNIKKLDIPSNTQEERAEANKDVVANWLRKKLVIRALAEQTKREANRTAFLDYLDCLVATAKRESKLTSITQILVVRYDIRVSSMMYFLEKFSPGDDIGGVGVFYPNHSLSHNTYVSDIDKISTLWFVFKK